MEVFPSILSVDFGNIEKEVKNLETCKADDLHIDIMDGHFVKNFSMGEKMVSTIKRNCKLFLDVHLMIYSPFYYVERFIAAGADMVTIHFEATEDIEDTLNYIKKSGKKAGLAFNPKTSVSMVEKYVDKCDLILFMAVEPGFDGQTFIDATLEKIRFTRELVDKLPGVKPKIQVDGGINDKAAKRCKEAGCDILVSGSYIFSGDVLERIRELKK